MKLVAVARTAYIVFCLVKFFRSVLSRSRFINIITNRMFNYVEDHTCQAKEIGGVCTQAIVFVTFMFAILKIACSQERAVFTSLFIKYN